MRIAITGESGFVAKNLINEINDSESLEFISLIDSPFLKHKSKINGEPCVFRNDTQDWHRAFNNHKIDVVVHNAAIVGTDVVALNPVEAVSTNLLGTQIITDAANNSNILNVYIGTTVIYDTFKYQDSLIKEDSDIFPRTHYAVQKYAGEMTVRNTAKEWLVMRPLFAYGGVGDPNSLIAKTFFAHKNNEHIPMFLDPDKSKDYMHVSDFCRAIILAINSNIRNEDFNISASNPLKTHEIIKIMSDTCDYDLNKLLKWHPETDYLGNHLLSCDKFCNMIGFDSPTIDLELGIKFVYDSIKGNDSDYNPLRFLQEAKNKNVDLLNYFPKL